MARTPRMDQIEAMLAEDPDDAFLRYGLAMEHASAGDHATCVEVLRDLIARTAARPYVPAFLQAGRRSCASTASRGVRGARQGVDAARRPATPTQGEMQGLLDSIE